MEPDTQRKKYLRSSMNCQVLDGAIKRLSHSLTGRQVKEENIQLDTETSTLTNEQERHSSDLNEDIWCSSNEICISYIMYLETPKIGDLEMFTDDSNCGLDPLSIENTEPKTESNMLKGKGDIDINKSMHFSEAFEMVEGKWITSGSKRTVARCKFCSKEVRRDKRQRHFRWHLMKYNQCSEITERQNLDKSFEKIEGKWVMTKKKKKTISKCKLCSKEVRRDMRFYHLKSAHSMIPLDRKLRICSTFVTKTNIVTSLDVKQEHVYNSKENIKIKIEGSKEVTVPKISSDLKMNASKLNHGPRILRSSMQKCHNAINETKDAKAKYSCRKCDKSFDTKRGRDHHLRLVHINAILRPNNLSKRHVENKLSAKADKIAIKSSNAIKRMSKTQNNFKRNRNVRKL